MEYNYIQACFGPNTLCSCIYLVHSSHWRLLKRSHLCHNWKPFSQFWLDFKVVFFSSLSDSFAIVRSTFKMLLKGFHNYVRPHADTYRSDLLLGVESRLTESDPATTQIPSEWPLREKADWFSLLCFLHFIQHLFQEQSLAAAEPELITHL